MTQQEEKAKQAKIYFDIVTCKSYLPQEGDTFTDQEVYERLNYVDSTTIERALKDLDKHNYISEVLNTTIDKSNKTASKTYRITSLCEEEIKMLIKKLTDSSNNHNASITEQ